MQTMGRTLAWNMYMGKRFLTIDQFIELCKEVGLYGVSSLELENYEREGWMYPVARLVMPENYAQAFWNHQLTDTEFQFGDVYLQYDELEMTLRYRYPPSHISLSETDLRHPIDKVWGKVEKTKSINHGIVTAFRLEAIHSLQQLIFISTGRSTSFIRFAENIRECIRMPQLHFLNHLNMVTFKH